MSGKSTALPTVALIAILFDDIMLKQAKANNTRVDNCRGVASMHHARCE
jgi:hypothetical protein